MRILFKIKPPASLPARRAYRPEGRAYVPEGDARKINAPVRSAGLSRHLHGDLRGRRRDWAKRPFMDGH